MNTGTMTEVKRSELLRTLGKFFDKKTDSFPEEALEEIRKKKLFKCFLPAELDGAGMNMAETLEIIDSCSYIDGSLGWLVQIGNGGNYFAGLFDETTSKELFLPIDAVLAGSGAATGIAKKVNGGYEVSGSWRYASGSAYASFFTIVCIVENENRTIACVVMPENVEVINDWKTIGLQNTSTNSFRVKHAFVADRFVFAYDVKKYDLPSDVFQFPFLAFAQLFFNRAITGLFRRLLDESAVIIQQQEQKWNAAFPDRTKNIAARIQDGRELLNEIDKGLDEYTRNIPQSGEEQQNALAAKLDAETKQWSAKAREIAHELFRLSGITALYAEHPFTRAYLDLICVGQHSLLNNY